MDMPLHPSSTDIAVRLVLTLIAGVAIGLNREAKGHNAGLRTTILVALAAAVAMIQANILLDVSGKTAQSFGVMDVLRFPLGVLTGVGFIGGGAILRRGDLVSGVTTAATLWVMTSIGLAFGGGQLALGVAATLLTLVTLLILKYVDVHIRRDHRAIITILSVEGPPPDLNALVKPFGYRARFVALRRDGASQLQFSFELNWRQSEAVAPSLDFLARIAEDYRIQSLEPFADKAL